MGNWVMQGKKKETILEPAYGLGVFSHTLPQAERVTIDAYELDSVIFEHALLECPTNVTLLNEDYFNSDWKRKYDGILCNPPYQNFHDYDNARYIPDVNSHLGLRLNGFTNLYTLFLLKSIAQLNIGGRLAYIIPSEFLNSDYGVEVKRALINSNTLQHIIVVNFTECAFDDALTTACILLCERNRNKSNFVRFSTIKDVKELQTCFENYMEYSIDSLDINAKWKKYYERRNGSRYNHLVPFSTFAKVSRGIATGANEYFTFKRSKADHYNIPAGCLMPCVCKAIDVTDMFFTLDSFKRLVDADRNVFLFNGKAAASDTDVKRYIRFGEESDINKRYLTAMRSPWYSIENRAPAPIWVSVFNRKGLRFIRNEASVYNLTTFHCVYPKVGTINTDILFAYLITDVAKKIFLDNSRQYGNGLVKFEPNDLNKGLIVDLRLLTMDECRYIIDLYSLIKKAYRIELCIEMLNDFFEMKYTNESYDIAYLSKKLQRIVKSSLDVKKRIDTSTESIFNSPIL